MAILGTGNDNINIDGADPSFVDFGGADTYTLLSNLSADVTITDVDGGTVNLPAGLDITAASFLADGVQFTINGNTVTIIGDPSLMTFVFGGTPLDPSAGTGLSFADTAVAFGTTVPAAGDPANDAVNTGDINDDGTVGTGDGTVELSIADASVVEGDSGTTALEFTISLDQAATEDVTFDFNTQATGTADPVTDYVGSAISPVTIAAGDTSVTVSVDVNGDFDVEADETFGAVISNPSANATIGTGTATGTIINDDSAGQNFILTTNQDVIPGMLGSEGTADNSGNDTVFGTINVDPGFLQPSIDTFTLGDNLNTGDGRDLLNLTVGDDNDDIDLFTTVLSNVEDVKFDITHQGLDEIDVNDPLNEIQGVILDFLNDNDRDDDLEVINVNPNAHLAVQNLLDGDGYDVTFFLNETTDPINGSILLSNFDNLGVYVEPDDNADGSSSMDVFSVEIHNVMNTNGDSEFYITDIEELNVHVTGDSELENIGNYYNNDGSDGPNPNIVNLMLDANLDVGFWDFSDDIVPAEFNIFGSGDLFIEDLDDGDSDLVLDSTGATGNVNIDDASNDFESFAAMFGIGDDRLIMEDGFSFDDTTADGGDGVDIFGGSLEDIQDASMDPDFTDNITNFEKIEVDDVVEAGEVFTIDMPTFNGIDYLISGGTEGANVVQPALPEIQRFSPVAADADGGIMSIFGANITISSGATDVQVSAEIAAAEADILAANADLLSVVHVPGQDFVTFTWLDTVGDIGPIGGSIQDESSSGVTFGAGSPDTPGVAGAGEQQEIDFGNPADTGSFTIATSLGNVTVNVLTGDTPDQVATKAAAALTASGLFASAVAAADIVTITYNAGTGPQAEPTFPDALTIFNAAQVPVASETVAAGVNTDEVQTYQITGAPTSDGEIVVGGVRIPVTDTMSVDDVGAAIKNAEADILAANPDLASVDYNTIGSELTFVFNGSAGDVPPIPLVDNAVLPVAGGFINTIQNGQLFIGDPEGVLNVVDVMSGGTVEFTGENDGLTDVIVEDAGSSSSDTFNIFLNGADALVNNGQVRIEDVETVNVMTGTTGGAPSGQALLNIIANEATGLNVSGNHGVVLFGSQLAGLTMFDGSGVTGEGATGGIFLDDFADDMDVTATGGSGDDDINAGVVGTGTMDDVGATLNGGAGEDILTGSAGADILDGGDDGDNIISSGGGDNITLGAGEDAYVLVDATHSTIATFDIIADFLLGEDLLDFSALGVVSFNGVEVNVFNNAADATTDLANNDVDGAFNVALDSSTGNVYADIDDDGIANSVIQLTGVTTLDDTAIFV